MSPFEIGPRQQDIHVWQYRWRSGDKAPPLLVVGAILLFIGSIFLLIMGHFAYKAHRLASEGKMAAGTVVKKVINQASDNGTSDTSYQVDYAFSAADGRKIEGKDTVDPEAWDQLKEGGPVQIEYAASAPRINQIGASNGVSVVIWAMLGLGSVIFLLGATLAMKGLLGPSSAAAGRSEPKSHADSTVELGKIQLKLAHSMAAAGPWTVFGAILFLAGAIFLLVGLASLHQERVFSREGKVVTGIVLTKTSHEQYDQQNDTHRTHYDLSYRFATADGKPVEGTEEVSWSTWQSIRERDPIQVIYLPQRPARNRLVKENPGMMLWLITVLGTMLTGGGTVMLGYGTLASGRARRSPKSTCP